MEDMFDGNGTRTYFVTELLIDLIDGKEYLHIKAKKEGLPFVVRRRLPASIISDAETLVNIGTDMHQQLGLAEEASQLGNLGALCEIEED